MKKEILILTGVLLFIFLIMVFTTHGFHKNSTYYNDYVKIERTERDEYYNYVFIVDIETIYTDFDDDMMEKVEDKFYIYYEDDVYPFYKLVNDNKIVTYKLDNAYYVKISDIRNVRVGD